MPSLLNTRVNQYYSRNFLKIQKANTLTIEVTNVNLFIPDSIYTRGQIKTFRIVQTPVARLQDWGGGGKIHF